MKIKPFRATQLRAILILCIIIVIGGSITGFYYTQDYLREYATGATDSTSTNAIGSVKPKTINQLRKEISDSQIFSDKASNVFASSQDYQNQIKSAVDQYAASTGISISSYDTASTPMSGNSNTLEANIKLNYVTVTINNPVQLNSLLQFLKLIETSLPKIQVNGISINRLSGSTNSVNIDPIIVGVYTK